MSGAEGSELIMDAGEAAGYKYVVAPTNLEKADRPEGLIISNNVQIKELNIESVDMIQPNATAAMLRGVE